MEKGKINIKDIPSWCYVNKNFKKIPFIPEKKIDMLDYQEQLWSKTFPVKKGIDLSKLCLTNIGKYSVAKLNVTDPLCKLIPRIYSLLDVKKKNLKDLIITESNGGLGGLTISLAPLFKKVNVVEIMELHADVIKHNISQYGLLKKIKIINEDFMDIMYDLKQDIIISDPPWGGPEYFKYKTLRLHLNNVDITCIINDLYKKDLFNMYILLVPKNFDIHFFTEKILSKSIFIKKYISLYVIFILNDKYL